METPVQIDFQGLQPSDGVREAIVDHIAGLENRYDRLTACRVVVKGPGAHHRTGGLYEVNIHLTLPNGREVVVGSTPKVDERHSDLSFAINDAFHRARRRLQDHVRRMQGQTKLHADTPIGTVIQLEPVDGFGMLSTADGREIFFHQNSVLNSAFSKLKIGTRVAFAEEMGDEGPQASTVKLLGKHGLR
jgi:cold shock CspA family protein/ribosome-associated translation inhibitor RaiA